MQILWNAMGPASKVIALQQKVDVEPNGYKELAEHIDLRHKIQYGTLEYKASARDDPMGLALMDDHKSAEAPLIPALLRRRFKPVDQLVKQALTSWTRSEKEKVKERAPANATPATAKDTSPETARQFLLLVRCPKSAAIAEAEDIVEGSAPHRMQH